MLGAIAGDIAGSVYEGAPIKTTDFPLYTQSSCFTDDSVLTIAVAEALLDDGNYAVVLQRWGRKYPHAGYGGTFIQWLFSAEPAPYNSWGNGSAMRVSPVGFAADSIDAVLREARRSATITHSHPEGIKGAQATALAIFLARKGEDKATIRTELEQRFGYDLKRTLDEIRPNYRFDVSCQGSVPEAIIAFLEGEDFEDTLRKAISLGGDSDTQACIAGGIAEPFYGGVPEAIVHEVRKRMPGEFIDVVERFYTRFMI